MTWHRWIVGLGAISGLAICNAAPAAETQRIGLPAGYYKIPAGGRLRIAGYCLDQNVLAPEVDVTVIPISGDEDKFVTSKGGSPVSLNKAVADRMLDFKTHERSLNEYLEQCEHDSDHLPTPEGTVWLKTTFDPPGADSDTGRIRAKFGELPLTEAMQEVHRYRIEGGAPPKSATNWISLSKSYYDQLFKDRVDKNEGIPPPSLFIEKAHLIPRQITLGATVTNHTDTQLLLELSSPLILSTDQSRGLENIDLAMIKTAKGYIGREKTQQQVWEANETLAAASSRNYLEYLSRFDHMPYTRGKIVQGLHHESDSSLVYVYSGDELEVRRVKNGTQEVIQRGQEAEESSNYPVRIDAIELTIQNPSDQTRVRHSESSQPN